MATTEASPDATTQGYQLEGTLLGGLQLRHPLPLLDR